MRKLFFLLLFIPILSNAQNCQSPMSAGVFKQKLNQLALQPNDQQKLQIAKNMLQGSCLLSSQVKDFAMVFTGDYYRLEFCKRAWKHVFDPTNFFDVYDTFGNLSNALRLYDYINHQEPPIIVDPGPAPLPPGPQPWYPNLAYPAVGGYRGETGCNLPLSDNDFMVLSKPVVLQKTDLARRTEGMKLVATNCITIGQAMKLATLFELETNRLVFLKEVYPKLYDLENYTYASEVFSNIPYKNDWLAYCASIIDAPTLQPPPPPIVLCEVPPQDFDDVKKSIANVSVNSTKLTLAKQIISTKKCFTVRQIAGITDLFAVESSRLDIVLFSYDYCINKADYYQLTESLNTTGSKNKLLEFLNTK